MKKKATTKRERKYGKKESEELEKLAPKKTKKKPTKKEPVEMYKILIDRASFTPPMSYEKCEEFINNKNKEAARAFRQPPLMSLVKV